MLYHIVAMAKNRVIGKDNKLPWHFSEDLKYFKKLTTGHTVIMGCKTFESIGKALPNRENFVLSRYTAEGSQVSWFSCIEEAIKAVKTDKAFIIGGTNIFEQTLDLVDGIYLTYIDKEYNGDAHYPEIPKGFNEKNRQVLGENPKLEAIYLEKV